MKYENFISYFSSVSFFLFLVLAVTSCGSNHSNPDKMQHQLSKSLDVKKVVHMDYLLYLPAGYHQDKTKEWPVLLFLHGVDERGKNLELVKKHGPPKIVEEKDFPFIIVSPQCPKEQWWIAEDLNLLLEKIIRDYRVDTNQVYLTGLSMGGFGAWELAVKYPNKFAAIVPICGGGNPVLVNRIGHIPIWVFHGAKDNIVPI